MTRPTTPPDIEAEIYFLPTEQGGRRSPAFSGYRPTHDFHIPGMFNDAHHEYIGRQQVPPGETALAQLWLLAPEFQVGRLYPGFNFTVQEGARIIGRGTVTKVLNVTLQSNSEGVPNPSLRLYNAARTYCLERHAQWCSRYRVLSEGGRDRVGKEYSDEAYDTYPRYNVLKAILTEIERIDSDALPKYPDLVELLVFAVQAADSVFTVDPHSPIAAAAMADERQQFVDMIRLLSPDSLPDTPPLPYKRVLSVHEVTVLRERLKARWAAGDGYFYPLAECADPTLRAFNTEAFDREFPPDRLQSILRSWGIHRIFELREYGDENYCLAVDAWEPFYNGAEGFWFSDTLDWILYASHEDSMTTGGTLTDALLSTWQDAERHIWGS